KHRLQLRRRQIDIARVDLAHAAVAPAEVGVEAEEFASHLDVMPPRQAPRRREVVANALRVLPDVERVGADGVAGELDDRRIADADGVKRKRSTLPADGGLIQ